MKQKLAISLTAEQWNVVLNAMANAPYAVVAPLIAEIQQQAQMQRLPEPAVSGPVNQENHQ